MKTQRKINLILAGWSLALGLLCCFPAMADLQSPPSAGSEIIIDELAVPAPRRPFSASAQSTFKNSAALTSPQLTPQQPQVGSLSFSWNMPVAMAVFQRQDKLWIVFDHPQIMDMATLKESAAGLATDIIQFPHPGATIIQLTPAANTSYNVRKEGLLWIVDLFTNHEPPQNIKDMTIFTQYDSRKRPYLYIPTENAGNLVLAIDPDVGDIITIAPVSDLGQGFNQTYFYPEFAMLKSAQGMALVIKAPDIILNRGNTGLTLRALDRGLNISEDLESIKRHQLYKDSDDSLEAFDINISPQLLKIPFVEAVEQLKQEILSAEPRDKNKARLELAKYYISQGLGTEALYILNQINQTKAPEASSDKFHAMLGVANFLTRRYAEAVINFEHGQLPAVNEAVFWRTLASTAQQFRQEDNSVLFSFISLIKDYPQELKDRIAMVGAQTALRAGDDLAAQNFIDILRTGENRLTDRRAVVGYLSAKKLELQGYPRNAIRDYRNISQMRDQKYSTFARYDNAVLSQQLGAMKTETAIAELEKLRSAWGKTDFKWKLLTKLADLYVRNNDYYNALRTLKENLVFSSPEESRFLQRRMLGWFEDIYLNNQADTKLSAVKSLALYNDFNWLAEQSPSQNHIIQKLADRLVAVDLLPRAAKLLEGLLEKSNLSLEERGKIGARLAIIHLFERNSPDALEVLNQTDHPQLSKELQAHRRVILARTLSNLGSIDEALELLADDYSKNALLLKTDIYWTGHQWDRASDTLKYLIEKPQPGKALSSEQIGYILDWATALKQAGKETVLVRLRNKFLPWFADTKYYSAFNILTSYLETDKIDLKEISQVVSDVQTFSDYAKVYNESLKNLDLK